MFLLNNIKFNIYSAHTIEENQYPAGWFLEPENRAAIGLVEVPDPVYPDPALYSYTENPDGSLNITLLEAEIIEQRAASLENSRIASLWQAAHEYEFAQINGSAIGLLTLGVLQGKPKSLAIQAWIKSIWTLYYERKADGSTSRDFSSLGTIPHTIPELMLELGV